MERYKRDPSSLTMDLEKRIHALYGSKIIVKTADAVYEGVIFFASRLLIMFKDLYSLPDRQYVGDRSILFSAIKSYEIVDSTENVKDVEEKNCEYRTASSNSRSLESNRDEEFNLKLPPKLASELPNDYLVLNAVDREFRQAVDYICCQSTIGVSLDGTQISRSGHLSWITISTPLCIFLFDVDVLGPKAFDAGLRNIFENKDIEKVIHDCRQSADCLTHLFTTVLVNVFDTQVADYVVNMQVCGDESIIKKVSSLDTCLTKYLKIPREFLCNQEKNSFYKREVNLFEIRPVRNECLNILVKNALYLVLLKRKLTEQMLNPFQRAVDGYLNVYANMCEAELVLETANSDEKAPKILTHNLQKVKYQDVPIETNVNPFMCYFKDPQTGEIIDGKNRCKKNQDVFTNNSLNVSNLMKRTMPNMQKMQSIVTKSSHDKFLGNERSSNDLEGRKEVLNLQSVERGKKCLEKSNGKPNSLISGNADVKLENNNLCCKNSEFYNNGANIETVQVNHVDANTNDKFSSENKLNKGDKSKTNILETFTKLHVTPKNLYNAENSVSCSNICFVPSGMGC